MGENAISPERIQRVFQNCMLDLPSSGVVHLHEISQKLEYESFVDEKNILNYTLKETGQDEVYNDFKLIGKILSLSLEKAYMRYEEFMRAIRKVSIPLQAS